MNYQMKHPNMNRRTEITGFIMRLSTTRQLLARTTKMGRWGIFNHLPCLFLIRIHAHDSKMSHAHLRPIHQNPDLRGRIPMIALQNPKTMHHLPDCMKTSNIKIDVKPSFSLFKLTIPWLIAIIQMSTTNYIVH